MSSAETHSGVEMPLYLTKHFTSPISSRLTKSSTFSGQLFIGRVSPNSVRMGAAVLADFSILVVSFSGL